MRKRVAILWCLVIISPGLAARQFPLVFDFGGAGQHMAPRAVEVLPGMKYSHRRGYGFLKTQPSAYRADSAFFFDLLTVDGVQAPRRITFRTDLDPGKYKILLYMNGGVKTNWKGKIRMNGILVDTLLRRYEVDVEGESPPDIWIVLKDVDISGRQMTLDIVPEDQPATLSGLKIFKGYSLPVRLSGGKLVQDR